MTPFEACRIVEGEDGFGSDDPGRVIEAWQHLIDTGLVWELQGKYGRAATSLISEGICNPPTEEPK